MSERIGKIKAHLREHKVVYLASGASFALGGISMLALSQNPEIKQTVDSWKFTIFTWKPSTINNISADLIRRGHPGLAVICKETKKQWASINHAALENGISSTALAGHLKGKFENAGGLHYEILGDMPTPVSQ